MKPSYRYWAVVYLFLACFLPACTMADQREKVFTIGILNARPSLQPVIDAFQAGLYDFGYREGETLRYQYDGAVDDPAALDMAAQKLITAKVDLIFALGTPATLAAKRAVVGTTIPVVFGPISDPIESGIVQSLTHPDGNLTGVRTGGYESKELEWLLGLAPTSKRILVPHDPNDAVSARSLITLLATAERFGIEVLVYEINKASDMLPGEIPTENIDAILILPTALALDHIDGFVATAIQHKLPLAVPTFPYVQAGGLVSYGSSYASNGYQISQLADRILKGVSPADLPVETAEFYLGLNLQVAEAIGLVIPNEIVQQARFIVR